MRWPFLSRCLFFLLLFASPLPAQQSASPAPLDPSQLPARTLVYLLWRGAPPADVRHANALMALWDDPDSAPLRNAMVQAMLSDAKKQKDKPALTREELDEYAALLDNSFIVGYLPSPADQAAPKPASSASSATAPRLFFLYDRTGKEAILSKAVLHMRGAETDIPKLTNLTVAGVTALKIERKSSVIYWAETGKYAVSANDLSVFEEILNRVTGRAKGSALADSPAYLEAKPLLNGGLLEFFLRIPSSSDIAGYSSGPNPQLTAVLKNLKLDALHLVAGHLSFEGAKTRIQGAVLGDPSTGSIFDIWADGKANPDTLRFLSASTVSFNESEINLLGIYKVIKQAFSQGSNNNEQLTTALESAAQTRLGMPLTDALGLATGEIASLQNSPTLDDSQQVRIMGIRNKPDAMKLLRTIMGEKITAERNEGAVTYMKISLGGTQGSAGVAQWNFYHLAMTPDFLLGSSKSEPLHALLAQSVSPSDGGSPKNILAARSQFPEKLNGFSYFDFQKLNWPAVKEKWLAEAKTAAAKAKTTDDADTSKKLTDWLSNVNPDVFPRHLHSMTGASWKDAKGVHFDEWIE